MRKAGRLLDIESTAGRAATRHGQGWFGSHTTWDATGPADRQSSFRGWHREKRASGDFYPKFGPGPVSELSHCYRGSSKYACPSEKIVVRPGSRSGP